MRSVFSMNQNWTFRLEEDLQGQVEAVCLPHTIALTPAISSGGRNLQAPCVYEKTLRLTKEQIAGKVFVRFEGAMGESALSVNGVEAKRHFCGYTPLNCDITDLVHPGDNTLTLRLDNRDQSDLPPGKKQEELDFSYDGGLYRDAWLTLTNRLYISDALLEDEVAGGGVFVWYEEVSEAQARVHVKAQTKNQTGEVQKAVLRCALISPKGELAGEAAQALSINPDEKQNHDFTIDVKKPELWSPDTPNLYSLQVQIIKGDKLVDEVTQNIGIRTFAFTRDKGLLLNGVSMRMVGANYHQTFPYIGNAMSNNLLLRDLMKLKKLGIQNLRCHYPYSEFFMDACDRLGMSVIVSNPGWQWFEEGAFVERCYQNMRDIIRWHRNHPSVIIWEPLPNETTVPIWFQNELLNIVHQEYPWGDCYTASDHAPSDINYREFDPGMLEPGMEDYAETDLKKLSDNPLWIREYGDFPDNWTDQNCAWRVPRGFGDDAMLKAVERMLDMDPQMPTGGYLTMFNREDICGFGIWPGMEHNRGYHINPCWGGFYDLFRVEKFTADFIASQQDREQAGDILSFATWWTEFSRDEVTVFSNAERVRLYHDNDLVDEIGPSDLPIPHPPFVFQNVRKRFKQRDRSTLTAQALVKGEVVAQATCRSPGVPVRLELETDDMGLPLMADGADLMLVRCKMLDREGNIVPLMGDRHPIFFEIQGEGEIVGGNDIGANPVCPEAGIACVLIRATKTPGEITLTARMHWPQRGNMAIKPDSLRITSVPNSRPGI